MRLRHEKAILGALEEFSGYSWLWAALPKFRDWFSEYDIPLSEWHLTTFRNQEKRFLEGGLRLVVAHVCGDPLSRYTCRATRVAAHFLRILGFFRCSSSIALHPPPQRGPVAPVTLELPGVSHVKLPPKRSRATGGCSSYTCGCRATVQLRVFFARIYATLGSGALGAKCAAGILEWFWVSWKWRWILQEPPPLLKPPFRSVPETWVAIRIPHSRSNSWINSQHSWGPTYKHFEHKLLGDPRGSGGKSKQSSGYPRERKFVFRWFLKGGNKLSRERAFRPHLLEKV